MLPSFNDDGVLPPGVWPCEMAELAQRFAVFRRTDRRLQLYGKLEQLLQETRRTGVVTDVIVDGSFVTDKEAPNDIDLILGLDQAVEWDGLPFWIVNVLDDTKLKHRYGFDVKVALIGSGKYLYWFEFFQKMRNTSAKKGVIRLLL